MSTFYRDRYINSNGHYINCALEECGGAGCYERVVIKRDEKSKEKEQQLMHDIYLERSSIRLCGGY